MMWPGSAHPQLLSRCAPLHTPSTHPPRTLINPTLCYGRGMLLAHHAHEVGLTKPTTHSPAPPYSKGIVPPLPSPPWISSLSFYCPVCCSVTPCPPCPLVSPWLACPLQPLLWILDAAAEPGSGMHQEGIPLQSIKDLFSAYFAASKGAPREMFAALLPGGLSMGARTLAIPAGEPGPGWLEGARLPVRVGADDYVCACLCGCITAYCTCMPCHGCGCAPSIGIQTSPFVCL